MAGVVAFAGPFDLDHFGAEIGEELSAPGPGEDAGQLDHLDTGERLHGRRISKTTWREGPLL
jgi:hypothetical protein